MPDEQTRQDYMDAYEDWLRQIGDVHKVLFEGTRLDPPRLKGLLNREARAKLRYDAARRKLLGISDETAGPENEGEA